jgi:hypothetical protein
MVQGLHIDKIFAVDTRQTYDLQLSFVVIVRHPLSTGSRLKTHQPSVAPPSWDFSKLCTVAHTKHILRCRGVRRLRSGNLF